MRAAVRTRGTDKVTQNLARVAAKAQRLGVDGADEAASAVSDGWRRSLRRHGPGWAPLKPSTVRDRIREGFPPGPPLVRSGGLEQALSRPVTHAERDKVDFAIPLERAVYVLSDRPLRLDRAATRAVAEGLNDVLMAAYRH